MKSFNAGRSHPAQSADLGGLDIAVADELEHVGSADAGAIGQHADGVTKLASGMDRFYVGSLEGQRRAAVADEAAEHSLGRGTSLAES